MIEFTGCLLIYNQLWAQLEVVLISCTPLVAADEHESDTSYFLIIIILMFTLLLAFTAVFTYKVLQKKARKETIKAFLQMTVENPGVVVVNRHLLISANNHIWKYLCCQGLNCDYQLFYFPRAQESSMLWEDSHLSAYPACLYINLSDNHYGSNSVWCRYWAAQC